MGMDQFKKVAVSRTHPAWDLLTARPSELYSKQEEIRSPFARDYTRILHSGAYRRLKHKTQVFFNIDDDHICTRMEHVNHVESASETIANFLGLNVELCRAIAIGHDLGHAPFGHQGETILNKLTEECLNQKFWHEKNGLRYVDKIETLFDSQNHYRNLHLTYAVRDGIISHCGEVDENGLKPRTEYFDLSFFQTKGQCQASTWEGCVVKICDKIAYLGRDIEDATRLGFLDEAQRTELSEIAKVHDESTINTTVIMHNLIMDICENSNPIDGICLSDARLQQMNEIKMFNIKNIYSNPRFKTYEKYASLVLNELFRVLMSFYGTNIWSELMKAQKYYPTLCRSFSEYLTLYVNAETVPFEELKRIADNAFNEKIYSDLSKKNVYVQAVIDFLSGMTDRFALQMFNELLNY